MNPFLYQGAGPRPPSLGRVGAPSPVFWILGESLERQRVVSERKTERKRLAPACWVNEGSGKERRREREGTPSTLYPDGEGPFVFALQKKHAERNLKKRLPWKNRL